MYHRSPDTVRDTVELYNDKYGGFHGISFYPVSFTKYEPRKSVWCTIVAQVSFSKIIFGIT